MSIEECSEDNLGACDDIYVMASSDGGETWDSVSRIGGYPGDAIRRRHPEVRFDQDTKYIFILYSIIKGNNEKIM